MEINNKILKWGIILNGIIFGFCILFLAWCRLDKPVFFTHYYEHNLPVLDESESNGGYRKGIHFNIRYIANVEDDTTVVGISFKEVPDIQFNASEYYSSMYAYPPYNFISTNEIVQNYGRYSIHTVYIDMLVDNLDTSLEQLQLSNAVIQFSNGNIVETDIGDITLYRDDPSRSLLDRYSSSTSSDGSSSSSFTVHNDITLTKLESPFLDKIGGLVDIKVNEYDYTQISGVKYNAFSQLTVSSALNALGNATITVFDIRPILYYKNEQGDTCSQRILDIRSSHYDLDFFSILKYLVVREAL